MRYDIIKTENYLLVVDDSEIKGWYYDFYIRKVKHSGGAEYVENGITKNIIAHLPLNSPILDRVDLLPSLEDEVEKLAKKHLDENHNNEDIAHPELYDMYNSFKRGYNQAKERYRFTEEDIFKAYDCGSNALLGVSKQSLINFLSQPKYPIGFECEMEWYNPKTNQSAYSLPEITGLNDNDGCYMKTKITSNSQGQTILVGKYIYR